MTSLIRATNLWGYDDLVRERGGDPVPLLARYGIPPAELRDDSSFLVYSQIAALFDDTARVLDYPEFGLRLAEFQGMDILGPISVIARSSATVGEAINSIARYLHLHSPALSLRNSLYTTGARPSIRFEFRIDDARAGGYFPQAYELSLSNSMQVMKLLCGSDVRPYSVHFMHGPGAKEAVYREVFQCPAHFNESWCGFHLPVSVFDLPLSSADHQTRELAERYLASQQAPNTDTLAEEVSRLIHTLLPTGQCSTAAIASHLAIHKRTLQRRLAQEGVSYEGLLAGERRRLATNYLMEPGLELSQIAGLLGYSEQSAFNRACRDWFGMTPRQYRRHLLEGHSSAAAE